MSTLDKNTIQEYLDNEKLSFKPEIGPDQKQPNSVDLKLGYDFFIPKTWEMTKKGRNIINVDINQDADNYEKVSLKKGQYFEVAPEEVVVGTTLERIEMKSYDIMAILYPRSSINRRGLALDLTGIIDTGYCGNLMIPIKNKTQSQVIRIYPGERFVQLVFHELTRPLTKQEAMKHGTSKPKYHQEEGDDFSAFKPDRK